MFTTPVLGEDTKTPLYIDRELSDLKRQTAINNKKIHMLEQSLSHKDIKENAQPDGQVWPPHYLGIPGTNSAIQFILNPNLSVTYDFEAFPLDILFPPFIPLFGVDGNAIKKGIFNAQGRASQIGFRTLSHTNIGEIKTEISIDFWGQTFDILRSNLAYQPRLRYGYVELLGFTIGQTSSNFLDLDATGETVDYGGIIGASFRHGLIKYTFQFNKKTTFSIAGERPATDYTDNNGALLATSSSSVPDGTFQLRHTEKFGYLSLRGLIRNLKIRDISSVGQTKVDNSFRKTGWAFGISGKLFVYHKSNVFAQYNFGTGIGRYIVICTGQAAFYNPTARIFDTQKATNLIAGLEHFWADALRSNLIYAKTRINVSRFMPALTGTTRVSKAFNQYIANLIYSPISNLDVGIEYEQADRTSVDLKYGKAKRITAGAVYKF